MNDNTAFSTASANESWHYTTPTEAREAARRAASLESAADGLRRLERRLALLAELAEPLETLVGVREHQPDRPVVLGSERVRRLSQLVAAIHALHEHHRFHREIVEEAAAAAPDWDAVNQPFESWRRRHALRCWEGSLRPLEASEPALRTRYERAIAAALPELRRFTTLEALQAHWYDERDPYLSELPEEPVAGTVEAWVQAARRSVPGGFELIPVIVSDATCWRRACEIDPTLPSLDLWGPDSGDAGDSREAVPAHRLLSA